MKKAFLILFTIVLFTSCLSSEDYKMITGKWECASWTNETTDFDKCMNNVEFEFNADKTYNSNLAEVRDTGVFAIVGEKLYVTPNGKNEFSVLINKLNSDTLEFFMNQAGNDEILTLLRVR